MGCGGYLDKIYKILVYILDTKAGFSLAIFFIWINFFCLKTKGRIGSYFCTLQRIQQKVALYEKICKRETSLIGQANGSKVVYLSADPNVVHFYAEYYVK